MDGQIHSSLFYSNCFFLIELVPQVLYNVQLFQHTQPRCLEYDTRNRRYRIHFSKNEIQEHERLLKELLGRAYREFSGNNSIA
jgi:hypothetical protein